ncbi:MAG: 50S ribosomal protein L2 [Thermoprotei archaeon]|nr:MAG: 50S ribosomal protein L2 [Thermoprotei archaeon]
MGKRLLVQRRGRGGSVFRSPSWKRVGRVAYRPYTREDVYGKLVRGRVVELLHDPGRGAPVARVRFEDGVEMLMVAAEGMAVGQTIYYGARAPISLGSILPVGRIPEGTMVCNVEIRPGDGGKLARSSGAYALILAHREGKTLLQLPSKKIKEVSSDARATIGIVAGGGRMEKPFLKAGKVYHLSKARSFKYPKVRGKAMGAYAHPAGGGHHPKGLTPVPRTAPPGQKVGHIAARRTGRRKGRRRR